MKLPISWLKDFIDLDGLSVEDIARKLTLAGLEVDEIQYAGLPMPDSTKDMHSRSVTNSRPAAFAWDQEKIVVAEIREVNAASQRGPSDPARPVRRSAGSRSC